MAINFFILLSLFGVVFQFKLFQIYGFFITTFDVASLFAGLYYLVFYRLHYSKVLIISTMIALLGFLSIYANIDDIKDPYYGLFFSIRVVEYCLWFYIGLKFIPSKLNLFIFLIFIKSVVSVFYGMYIDLGNWLFFKYDQDIVASLLLISIFYFKSNRYGIMFISFFLSLTTQVRSSIFGASYFLYLYLKKNRETLRKFFILLLLPLIIYILSSNKYLVQRIETVLDYNNILAIEQAYIESKKYTSYFDFVHATRSRFTRTGDLSFHLRLRKWMFFISQLEEKPMAIFYGFSPGIFQGAADSSLFRILIEGGILMFYLYWRLAKKLIFYSPNGKEYLFMLIFLSLMLDFVFSSVIAPLALFLIGASKR